VTATDQSTPAPMAPTGDPQAARRARREQLLALTNLDYPTQAERNAVAALLAVEFEESDRSRANSVDNAQYARHAWASVEHANERTRQGVERLRKAREQRNEAQQRAKTAEHILDAVRDARNWTAV
jgi:predicted ribosome quality control (RQC) complex YloA/Tae2 family protein